MPDSIKQLFRPGMLTVFLVAVQPFVSGQQINAGVFGGIHISQVQGDTYAGFNKLGFNAGMYVSRLIESNFYWQAEIKYGTRGVYEGPTDSNQSLYRSSYHILELPISVNYLFDEKIQVELGTSPEVLVTTLFWDEGGLMDKSTYPDNRRFGLSVFAGLGYWLSDRMMAGVRYINSAIPFRDPEEWNNPQYRGYFHSVISLSLAYRIKQQ